jgi:hypothetical protein
MTEIDTLSGSWHLSFNMRQPSSARWLDAIRKLAIGKPRLEFAMDCGTGRY